MKIFHLVFIFLPINGKSHEYDKKEFCENLECDESAKEKVCGVKYGEEEILFKMFDNECKLLKYGCRVDDNETYGIIDKKHCTTKTTSKSKNNKHIQFINTCIDCKDEGDPVCGIRQHGEGFKIRIFKNECQLNRHNCERETQFTITDYFICSNDLNSEEEEITNNEEFSTTLKIEPNNPIKTKNLVIVDGSMLDRRNINQSIRNFFAATHVLDLPMRDIRPMFNESTRRRLVKVFGPVVVYKPWVEVPKNISEDYYHRPTLASCYHRCPTKCPDTYAPVCGVPGMAAREPSLMFQNHCFMDVAQCKMKWEDKSYTAESSAYIETSFLFCLGDEMNSLYRFLPLIKTLQHMGRLKSKGHFRYKLRNMKFFNELMSRQAKIMG